MDCPLKYIGQTVRTFKTRHKEYIQAIRANNANSGYSNHMLNTGHTYECITNTMQIFKTEKKYLNTLEKYHIYMTRKGGLQVNDIYIDTRNTIFEVIQDLNNR
jgi:hypothetical protein